jgi:hypothetical protein
VGNRPLNSEAIDGTVHGAGATPFEHMTPS